MTSVASLSFSSKKAFIFAFLLGSLLASGPLVAPVLAQADSSVWGLVSDETDAGVLSKRAPCSGDSSSALAVKTREKGKGTYSNYCKALALATSSRDPKRPCEAVN